MKELSAVHHTARIIRDDKRPMADIFTDVVNLLPASWQYPEVSAARIQYDNSSYSTEGFRKTEWTQEARFGADGISNGIIEVCYLEEKPQEDEGSFLEEERELIYTLAEMLRNYVQRKQDMTKLQAAHDHLEELVQERTGELRSANKNLENLVEQYQQSEQKVREHRKQLQRLASELLLTEERERRMIARQLHDSIGQALAFMKIQLTKIQGDMIFNGDNKEIENVLNLLNMTIKSSRNLTFEISPPILYELGLLPALEWLAEQFETRYKLKTKIKCRCATIECSDDIRILLFTSIREIMSNVYKHAEASKIIITILNDVDGLSVEVKDNGKGFNPATLEDSRTIDQGFGIFSIRERIEQLDGSFSITSKPGKGTSVSFTIRPNLVNKHD